MWLGGGDGALRPKLRVQLFDADKGGQRSIVLLVAQAVGVAGGVVVVVAVAVAAVEEVEVA